MTRAEPAPEFSRLVAIDRLPDSGHHERVAATPEECAALARRFAIPEITGLKALARISRTHKNKGVLLEATLEADVVQNCIVSLEPVSQHVKETFSVKYLPAELVEEWEEAHRRMGDEGELVDPDAEDPPEVLSAQSIDIGEAIAEHLALSLDPYPRAPGSAFDAAIVAEAEEEAPKRPNPFAILKTRRDDA